MSLRLRCFPVGGPKVPLLPPLNQRLRGLRVGAAATVLLGSVHVLHVRFPPLLALLPLALRQAWEKAPLSSLLLRGRVGGVGLLPLLLGARAVVGGRFLLSDGS